MNARSACVMLALVMITCPGTALAQDSECPMNDLSGCEYPGKPCIAFGHPGNCRGLGIVDPCKCERTSSGSGEGTGGDDDEKKKIGWFEGGGDLGLFTGGYVMIEGPGGGRTRGQRLLDTLQNDPRRLIGTSWCAAQWGAFNLVHSYGDGWPAGVAADRFQVTDTELCFEFTRMAEPGEECGHENWIVVTVVRMRAEHDGIRPNGLGGLVPTGKIVGNLDPAIESFGAFHFPSGVLHMWLNTTVTAEMLASFATGRLAVPITIEFVGRLTDTNGADQLEILRFGVDGYTPPGLNVALPD